MRFAMSWPLSSVPLMLTLVPTGNWLCFCGAVFDPNAVCGVMRTLTR